MDMTPKIKNAVTYSERVPQLEKRKSIANRVVKLAGAFVNGLQCHLAKPKVHVIGLISS